MSLAQDAANDWTAIMNNDIGATWPCTITSPDGVIAEFKCRYRDISQRIDPGTNQTVSGREVVISISMLDLDCKGMTAIKGVEDNDKKPWKVSSCDIIGRDGIYKVVETRPDASIGNMVIDLELLK